MTAMKTGLLTVCKNILLNKFTLSHIGHLSHKNTNYYVLDTTGTSQGLKLTLNVETEEYMAGPVSGSGALVRTKLFIVS